MNLSLGKSRFTLRGSRPLPFLLVSSGDAEAAVEGPAAVIAVVDATDMSSSMVMAFIRSLMSFVRCCSVCRTYHVISRRFETFGDRSTHGGDNLEFLIIDEWLGLNNVGNAFGWLKEMAA